MVLPETAHGLSFKVTRASHARLRVAELERSLHFYENVIGLTVTAREERVAYLRGIEESCHHSLVLVASQHGAACERIGFRVFTDEQLEALARYVDALGLRHHWSEITHQGLTLSVEDPAGVALEFCAHMPVQERLLTKFHLYRGGAGLRLDHFQVLVPDVEDVWGFYTSLGFRVSEYVTTAADQLVAAFLQTKGNPHDIVLFSGDGPRLHHVAFTTADTHSLLHACDVAGELGYGGAVERGPGRHGPGHALYVYMRDPDGHRVELFTTHYQTLDADDLPIRWEATDPGFGMPWGLPAQRTWHLEASPFVGTPIAERRYAGGPVTLEDFLTGA